MVFAKTVSVTTTLVQDASTVPVNHVGVGFAWRLQPVQVPADKVSLETSHGMRVVDLLEVVRFDALLVVNIVDDVRVDILSWNPEGLDVFEKDFVFLVGDDADAESEVDEDEDEVFAILVNLGSNSCTYVTYKLYSLVFEIAGSSSMAWLTSLPLGVDLWVFIMQNSKWAVCYHCYEEQQVEPHILVLHHTKKNEWIWRYERPWKSGCCKLQDGERLYRGYLRQNQTANMSSVLRETNNIDQITM